MCQKLTRAAAKGSLFDHLIGAQHQAGGNFMADHFRGLQIDDQLEPAWLFDREIGRRPRQPAVPTRQ
jgi:hypothetical protein